MRDAIARERIDRLRKDRDDLQRQIWHALDRLQELYEYLGVDRVIEPEKTVLKKKDAKK